MELQPKVLLVENDYNIANALSYTLKNTYSLEITNKGQDALNRVNLFDYDLILLDPDLPDIPGLAVCQQLRNRGFKAPILILSKDDKVLTKISLLDAGANDYLTKPFSLGELKARIRVLQRQSASFARPLDEKLEFMGIVLNCQAYTVQRDGIDIKLRRKEFELLEYMMSQANRVVSRETLLAAVWKNKADLWANTIDVHIKYLRDKVDKPFTEPLIQTIHGKGYKLGPKTN